MVKKKKSWVEKLLDSKDFPRVDEITEKMSKRWGTGTVVIPAPLEIDALMKKVPKGKLVTINQIREVLAKKHNTTISCPITTTIFARIAAGAAEEHACILSEDQIFLQRVQIEVLALKKALAPTWNDGRYVATVPVTTDNLKVFSF